MTSFEVHFDNSAEVTDILRRRTIELHGILDQLEQNILLIPHALQGDAVPIVEEQHAKWDGHCHLMLQHLDSGARGHSEIHATMEDGNRNSARAVL